MTGIIFLYSWSRLRPSDFETNNGKRFLGIGLAIH